MNSTLRRQLDAANARARAANLAFDVPRGRTGGERVTSDAVPAPRPAWNDDDADTGEHDHCDMAPCRDCRERAAQRAQDNAEAYQEGL